MRCPKCNGAGWIAVKTGHYHMPNACPKCKGTGQTNDDDKWEFEKD